MARNIEFAVRIDDDERRLFHEVAKRDGLSVGALVRNLMARRAQEQATPRNQRPEIDRRAYAEAWLTKAKAAL